jgi:hypothetical protein
MSSLGLARERHRSTHGPGDRADRWSAADMMLHRRIWCVIDKPEDAFEIRRTEPIRFSIAFVVES